MTTQHAAFLVEHLNSLAVTLLRVANECQTFGLPLGFVGDLDAMSQRCDVQARRILANHLERTPLAAATAAAAEPDPVAILAALRPRDDEADPDHRERILARVMGTPAASA